jgi:parallel beta-helix repeat protein
MVAGCIMAPANNCTISGNTASDKGGGLYGGIANNCTISGNAAGHGGGMCNGTANNCTISGNSASRAGGMYNGSAHNCIIWYNEAIEEINLRNTSATNCASTDVLHGVNGNITNAPMLLSASYIAANSPCRSAGNPAFSSGTDIDGQAWLNPPSIGCDELYGPGTFTGPIELALSVPDYPLLVGYPGAFRAGIQGVVSETQVAFGDGEISTNSPYIFEHTWAAEGDYNVVLTAFNDSYASGISVTQAVHVVTAESSTIYVSGTTGNDADNGLSWATAKQTIQAGVDAQNLVGGRVVISNGTYVVSSEISVKKNIRVVGLNGPDYTMVDGGGSNRCFNLGNSACIISGLTITNGFSSSGGGIYCSGNTPIITNCTINGNTALRGGGLHFGTAINCSISGNAADYRGGGLSDGIANNCTISGNTAGSGGGMYRGTATNCVISGNFALGRTGSEEEGGGGMYRGAANNCTISGNSAPNGEGGGLLYANANQCTISGNSAWGGGGMSAGTANNCAISRNTAENGGGLSSVWANNCTIIRNSALYSSGGMFYSRAKNCIIWYNEAAEEKNMGYYSTASYCSSPGVTHGADGNITNAPLLVAGFHLATNSPCRGAGSSVYATGTDIDGEAWLNPPSIGCDEILAAVAGPINLRIVGPSHICTGWEASYIVDIRGPFTGSLLDSGDGAVVTNEIIMPHIWRTPGVYDMVLTAYNDDHSDGVTHTQRVEVVSADESAIHVSNATGKDADDGRSWATAKKSIQSGVDAQTVLGGLVLVSNGTYEVREEVLIGKEIAVRSISGSGSTIVDGCGSNRCFYLKASNCQISGFTITNGFADYEGGGIYCLSTIPVVSNCTISGNTAEYGGGMYYGTAKNCTFSENAAPYGAGIMDGNASNCAIVRNSAADSGGGMFFGTANNCTISGNSASDSGGGMQYGTAFNCEIIRNSAGNCAGGMYYGNAYNCSISGNSAGDSAGGMYKGKAYNCVISGNTATSYNDLYYTDSHHSCSPDLTHGNRGNTTNAPLYVDAANGNYRLQSNSPCINWGNNSYVSISTDMDGNPRIIDGYVDMGCYEYQGLIGEADNDVDGVSDAWERLWFGMNIMPDENADGDWSSNGDEYIAGTDPTNAASFFRATFGSATNSGSNHLVITWKAVTGRVYNVYWTPSLMEEFQPLELGITYPQNSYTDLVHSAESSGFYRVIVMRADYDADGDGLPNDWESRFGVANALADVDNDGFNNISEYIAGTDPTNDASYFMTTGSVADKNGTKGFVVEWISIPDRLYSIEWAPDLLADFQPLETAIEHPQKSYLDTAHLSASNAFYKVDVRLK